MALSKADLEAIAAIVDARVAAAVAAPVASAQASGPTRSADGRDFPCTAKLADGQDPCSRKLRSAARAAVHGADAGGHEYRAQ